MPTHPMMLIAYDPAGNVVATLDQMVIKDPATGAVRGLVDFAAHEEAGGEHTLIWEAIGKENDVAVPVAKGSKVWPEWIGSAALDFRVELEGPAGAKRIAALVHKRSGHRRVRAAIEDAIQTRIDERKAVAATKAAEIRAGLPRRVRGKFVPVPEVVVEPEPTDIRDLTGGPSRPLRLDEEGRSLPWISLEEEAAARPQLPLLGVQPPPAEAVVEPPAGGPLPTPR